jgi:hypothetical protein
MNCPNKVYTQLERDKVDHNVKEAFKLVCLLFITVLLGFRAALASALWLGVLIFLQSPFYQERREKIGGTLVGNLGGFLILKESIT